MTKRFSIRLSYRFPFKKHKSITHIAVNVLRWPDEEPHSTGERLEEKPQIYSYARRERSVQRYPSCCAKRFVFCFLQFTRPRFVRCSRNMNEGRQGREVTLRISQNKNENNRHVLLDELHGCFYD